MFEVSYQKPKGATWSISNMFDRYYAYLCDQIECVHIEPTCDGPGTPNSQHVMTIKNINTKKYFVISYWDNASDIINPHHGWDISNMVEMFSSLGVFGDTKATPVSCMSYSIVFDDLSLGRKSFKEKENNDLIFRGFLHGIRGFLPSREKIKITSEKLFPEYEYFKELTNSKICLSLNGVAEISHRDIEILSAGSVLFRPYLHQKFHNELLPNVHYIPFDISEDPVEQMNIIEKKWNEIKNDDEFLSEVCENGYKWFLNNGTVQSNVDILKKVVKLELIK